MNKAFSPEIPKEEIMALKFHTHEVLEDPQAISIRSYLLRRAHELGNSLKSKVRIQFLTTDGPREVHTTVWDLTEEFIGLKSGAHIPVRSVLNVSI